MALSGLQSSMQGKPVLWAVINQRLASLDAPTLGGPDPRTGQDHESYAAFEKRWNDPIEGAILKKLVDRFDGQGVVLAGGPKDLPGQQGKQGPNLVAQAADRANSLNIG